MSIISESEGVATMTINHYERILHELASARELLESEKNTRNHIIRRGIKMQQELDEAREQVKELIYIAGRAIELAEIDFENDKFGVVSELRDGLQNIIQSGIDYHIIQSGIDYYQKIKDLESELRGIGIICEKANKERDEAREDLFALVNEWLDVSEISDICAMRTLRLCARELSELVSKNIHLNGGTKQEEAK